MELFCSGMVTHISCLLLRNEKGGEQENAEETWLHMNQIVDGYNIYNSN